MRTRRTQELGRRAGAAALLAVAFAPSVAAAQPRAEDLVQLAKNLPQSRRLSSFIGKQCDSLRATRDQARAVGVWGTAPARDFGWDSVQQSLDALGRELPEAMAAETAAAEASEGAVEETIEDAARRASAEAAAAAAAAEAAEKAALEQRYAQLRELAASIDAVATACDAVAAGDVTSESLGAISALLASGQELSWAQDFFRRATEPGVRAEQFPELVGQTKMGALPPAESARGVLPTVAASPLARAALSELEREAVQTALEQLGVKICAQESRRYAKHLCGVVGSITARPLEELPERLKAAARSDLAELPIQLVGPSAESREAASAVALGLLLMHEVSRGQESVVVLARLSGLTCSPGAELVCQSEVGRAARQAGIVTSALLAEGGVGLEAPPAPALAAEPAAQGLSREQTAAVLLTAAAWLERGPYGKKAPLTRADVEDAHRVVQSLQKLAKEKPQGARQVAASQPLGEILALVQRRLQPEAPSAKTVGVVRGTLAGWESGDIVQVARATGELLAATKLHAPEGSDDVIALIIRLASVDSVDAALEALANAPGVQDKVAELLGYSASAVPDGTFADHPVRRKNASGPRTGLAKYVAGVRASYVFQHWSPQEIPDAYYETTGLHLLRGELLLNLDELSFLRWLETYLKFELKPGGDAKQDQLLERVKEERSGWESFLGNLHTALPFLSSEDTLRGPTYSFSRRYFLASAQALEDYWYYSGGGVQLLVPGDTISTSTVFTRHRGGFRSTTLGPGGKPSWSYELGGYYLHYRKPYSHDRLAALPGTAIFDATFEGAGAFVEGKWHVPVGEDDPWIATLGLYGGPASILLDDVPAASVLPSDSRIWNGEVEAALEVPAVWFGGLYLGGKVEFTYRTFGEWFSSGESDAGRTNTRMLNDDIILGVSAVGGYFL